MRSYRFFKQKVARTENLGFLKLTYNGTENNPPFSAVGDVFKDIQTVFNVLSPQHEVDERLSLQVKSIKSGSIVVELAWEVAKDVIAAASPGVIVIILKRLIDLWKAHQHKKSREYLELAGFSNPFLEFCEKNHLTEKDLTRKTVLRQYKETFVKLDADFEKKSKMHQAIVRSSVWTIEYFKEYARDEDDRA